MKSLLFKNLNLKKNSVKTSYHEHRFDESI